jgi:uncharacterized membrane protein YraQ (UPF0718 family)
VAHIYVMEWAAVIREIVIGLLIAGAVAAWVRDSFWQSLFLTGGRAMLAMMGGGPDEMARHDHAGHDQTGHDPARLGD